MNYYSLMTDTALFYIPILNVCSQTPTHRNSLSYQSLWKRTNRNWNGLISHCRQNGGTSLADGALVVQDDLAALLQILPEDLRENLQREPRRAELLEVVLDLGRRPEARFLGDDGGEYLRTEEVIVDTSNEIGGDGDIPHSAIGGARRMQVPEPSLQHKVMVEAVENHMPEVIIVDEIGTEAEALACRTIAERGVMLVGTAHGERLENIIKNHILCDLVGGVQVVTLGDDEARARGTQKSVLERKAPPTFPLLIEMRERSYWVAHRTERSVDVLLHGGKPLVEVRTRDDKFKVVIERWKAYEEGKTRW